MQSSAIKAIVWSPGVDLTVNANTMLRQQVLSKEDLETLIYKNGGTQIIGFCTLGGGTADQMQVTFSRYGSNGLFCQIDNRYAAPLSVRPSVCILMK